jgi:hypothetical protein
MSEMTPDTGGTLLMISDIEGCAKIKKIDGTEYNLNTSLCSATTYQLDGPLFKFLQANPKNKIAFLGDYFDLGNGVVDSINGIAELHKAFNTQVHIIVGNRDINKFRLGFEFFPNRTITEDSYKKNKECAEKRPPTPRESPLWTVWNGFYNIYMQKDNSFKFLTDFINTSMGAPGPINIIDGEDGKKALYLLKPFTEDESLKKFTYTTVKEDAENLDRFVKNCRYLFKHSKIVIFDDDFKVLLSHAGGFDESIFHDEQLYAECYDEMTRAALPYFENIELIRKRLDRSYRKDISIKDTLQKKDEEYIHNIPWISFLNQYFNEDLTIKYNSSTPIPKEHFLLQALGLKPDDNGSGYASFIQSCSSSCNTLVETKPNIISKLQASGVKIVAHGHIPHCVPQPLIYSRSESDKKVIFIANDTSNGNRLIGTGKSGALNELPLSYIKHEGETLGVSSLTDDGALDSTNTYRGSNEDPTTTEFSELVAELSSEEVPEFSEINRKITWSPFDFTKLGKRGNATAHIRGGKSKKNQKKSQKGKKQGGKRTRKANKKTYKCSSHGCRH